jgi:2-dehydro-3-deoxyphosphogluconate aldolase/(4S)-4-hydroxy-2-oxoglutarate aldolase
VKIEDARQASQLAQALIEGGLPCAEVTFRTTAAEQAIAVINKDYPNILVGAGTVLTVEQAQRAVGVGARFIVSPGFTPKVANWCLENSISFTPGAATATEIVLHLDLGLKILKFFPAEVLRGINALKAFVDVFFEVAFILTGGITPANSPVYLRLKNAFAVGVP